MRDLPGSEALKFFRARLALQRSPTGNAATEPYYAEAVAAMERVAALTTENERLREQARLREIDCANTEAELATARADALREVREQVADLYPELEYVHRDDVLAILDAPRGEGEG